VNYTKNRGGFAAAQSSHQLGPSVEKRHAAGELQVLVLPEDGHDFVGPGMRAELFQRNLYPEFATLLTE